MAISFVDNAASQEMNVALNQGAVNLLSDQLIPKDEKETERTSRHKSAQELEVSKLLDNKSAKKLTVDILKPFFSKLAQVGINIGPQAKIGNQSDRESEKTLGKLDSFEDQVEIKNKPDVIKQIGKLGKQGGGGSSFAGFGSSQEEVLAMLKEFAGLCAEYASSQSQELLQQLKDLRAKLKERGISEAKLQSLEAGLKSGQKVDLSEIVKEALILQMLSSDSKIEKAIYGRGVSDLLKQLPPHEAREIMKKARFKAIQELQGFSLEELENVLIRKTHLQDLNYKDALKLLDLAEKTGLDIETWVDKTWEKKKDDHGLFLLDVPHSATGLTVDTNTDNPAQKQKHGFEYEKKDENEVLVNRLRALYMQIALKGKVFALKNIVKIMKLRNGLFRLGIFTEEMDEQVKHEAEVVAKIKIIEMLKEALVERATFYELAGPAHKLVERKIKGLLKNAERLGMPISTQEFNLMRDKANLRVFELSKKELEDVRVRRSAKDSPKLEKKEKLLIKLLVRLKEESQIEESVPEAC